MSRPGAFVLTELIDAAEVTNDFLTGVVDLARGQIGGRTEGESRFGRRLAAVTVALGFRRDHVARGLAAAYGPEQLRKGAIEARRLAALVDELRLSREPALIGLVRRLDELEMCGLADVLDSVSPRSADLRAAHRRLASAQSAMAHARTQLVLGRRGPDR